MLKNILIAFDQLLNALAGGWPDETLSARAWREGWHKPIDMLFFWEPSHCYESYVSEQLRMQSPPEERDANS